MNKTEITIESISVNGAKCIGCKNRDMDVMLSYMPKSGDGEIVDLFITDEVAIELHNRLGKVIESNKRSRHP